MSRTFLIARREYLAYVSAWGFWVGLLLTPLLLFLAISLPQLVEGSQPIRYFTVLEDGDEFTRAIDAYMDERQDDLAIGLLEQMSFRETEEMTDARIAEYNAQRGAGSSPAEALSAIADLPPGASLPEPDFIRVDPPAGDLNALMPFLQGEQTLDGPVGRRALFAIFTIEDDQAAYWSEDVVNSDLPRYGRAALERLALSQTFDEAGVDPRILVEASLNTLELSMRSPSASNVDSEVAFVDQAPFYFAMGFSFLLWMLIFSVVNYLLTGTIEERSNKIFDTLLTSSSLNQLLTGKLMGVLMLSLTLIGIWSLSGGTMAFLARDAIPPEIAAGLGRLLDPGLIIPTIISFVMGYLIFGSIFLALGSLCDTIQEAQSLLTPILVMMMVPLLMIPVSLNNPDSGALVALSWVPILSPFLVILRVPTEPPLWQLVLQILWMGFFTGLTLWAAARVYKAGAVHGAGVNDVRVWFTRLFRRSPKKPA